MKKLVVNVQLAKRPDNDLGYCPNQESSLRIAHGSSAEPLRLCFYHDPLSLNFKKLGDLITLASDLHVISANLDYSRYRPQ